LTITRTMAVDRTAGRVPLVGCSRHPSGLAGSTNDEQLSPPWAAVRPGVRVGVRPSARSVHPDRLSCREGGEEQEEWALTIGEAALGPDHPTVATIRGNLSGVLQALKEKAPGEESAF
jgi:hypothetical protein